MVDKAIADRLGEPLLHVIRNAAAHGVEPPAERIAAGKPAEATIALCAEPRGNRVVVTVADDGRGLDLAAIAARARRLGIETGTLSAAELQRLVFVPGLSTAATLSTLSGRGVGLDVVATTIDALGGRVDVASTPGQGARFWFDLPRTRKSP
jgi:two-component system chemotaxis sensor kinase CheA